MTTKLTWITLIAAIAIACSPAKAPSTPAAAAPTSDPVATYVRIYGGSAGVYRSILAETSCSDLQEQLYTATQNSSTGFQAAITDRGAALACPELKFVRP